MCRVLTLAALFLLGLTYVAEANFQNRSYDAYLGRIGEAESRWFSEAFEQYEARFIDRYGRVLDLENGRIVHSEGQAYGMLLALLGNRPDSFERIWRFTKVNLQRSDALLAWKYIPGRGIVDRNNATDGDLLAATALKLAGMRWGNAAYLEDARAIADAVGRQLIIEYQGHKLLLPGEWARPDNAGRRATINLSYFIPITFPVMRELAPQHRWDLVERDGLRLLDTLVHPPSDWSHLDENGRLVPAWGFPPVYSFDAVRIPLYLMMDGRTSAVLSQSLFQIWGSNERQEIFAFDVLTGERRQRFWDTSYRFVYELLQCAEKGRPVSAGALRIELESYFSSSLHIMALAAMYAHYPQCYPANV